jgi:hypothetical protein
MWILKIDNNKVRKINVMSHNIPQAILIFMQVVSKFHIKVFHGVYCVFTLVSLGESTTIFIKNG